MSKPFTLKTLNAIHASGGNNASLTYHSATFRGDATLASLIRKTCDKAGIKSRDELTAAGKDAGMAGWRLVWSMIRPSGADAEIWHAMVLEASPKGALEKGEKATITGLANTEANGFKGSVTSALKTAENSVKPSPSAKIEAAVKSALTHEDTAERLTGEQIVALVAKTIAAAAA